jgi:pyruvate dehydrogenase E1 component alpha subunit
MPGRRVDGFEFLDVYDAVHDAVARARNGKGPSLLDVKLEGYYPHEQGVSDAMRLPEHLAWLKANRDPLKLLRSRMLNTNEITEDELEEIDRAIGVLIDDAVAEAKAAPPPPVSQLLTDVYLAYP